MTAVYLIRVVSAILSALILASCGSAKDAAGPAETPTPSPGSSAVKAAGPTCPADPPASTAAPEWTLAGATGSVSVIGSTDTAAPLIDVQAPFSVTQTQVQTLRAGDGPDGDEVPIGVALVDARLPRRAAREGTRAYG